MNSMSEHSMNERKFDYDIAFSFAGEDREYVERVADFLIKENISIFYDKFEVANLWGKDLYSHLDSVYGKKARFCVVFVSESYSAKLWTNHERVSAQARAFSDKNEYILPARFDDTEIPGIRDTVGYIDLRELPPEEFGQIIIAKLERNISGLKLTKPIESQVEMSCNTESNKAVHARAQIAIQSICDLTRDWYHQILDLASLIEDKAPDSVIESQIYLYVHNRHILPALVKELEILRSIEGYEEIVVATELYLQALTNYGSSSRSMYCYNVVSDKKESPKDFIRRLDVLLQKISLCSAKMELKHAGVDA